MNETVIKSANKFIDGRLDYRKRLNYFFKDDIELLCVSFGVYNRSASVNILQQLTGKHTSNTTLVTFLCLAVVVSLFVGLICIMRRRGKNATCRNAKAAASCTTPPLKLPELDSSSKTIPAGPFQTYQRKDNFMFDIFMKKVGIIALVGNISCKSE
ncbi:hypothetical protein HOLleu_04359 [Holothuria leucospilota]|uniref:Uncharacterized protein n=1 Tax=Holothuria leucospilota TaxID=206669 RepID=A0A9Q1HI72_HOLLE|nr:hypothetical protein HOLleu_04359 [Holothuria leucospilota]